MILLYYFLRMSRGRQFQDLVFNSMALYLLQGRFDVDPSIIGDEAFVRDGRAYAYSGIFPALLRMILVPFLDISALPLGQLFTVIALSIGAFAQVATVMLAFRVVPVGPARAALRPRLMLLALLSGPPILIGMSASMFDESISWAWSQATVFVALLLHGLTRPQGVTAALLAALATVAGMALHTRVTTAIGLYAALAFLIFNRLLRDEADKSAGMKNLLHRCFDPSVLMPVAIMAVFAVAAGFVNFARWGDPLIFADIRAQEYLVRQFPDRIARFETYGLFNLARVGYGVIYYFVPVWPLPAAGGGLLFESRVLELFDAFELPPTSFFLSDPLTMILALTGVFVIARGHIGSIARGPLVAASAGLAIPPAMMLSAWYMTFRYRLEFMPLITLLSSLGGAAWASHANRWPERRVQKASLLFVALFVLQILSAHAHGYLYLLSPYGPSHRFIQGGLVDYYRERLRHFVVVP